MKTLECQVSALFTTDVDAEQTNIHDMIKKQYCIIFFYKNI